MKKINIILIFLATTLLVSCDNVPVSERKKAVDISSFKKPVVVVDFTGVDCTNCPKAAEAIKKMHEQAGDKIIGVAMYPDCSFNHHSSFDLKCPEATEYYKTFGDISKIVLPSGMVDFANYNNQLIIDYTLWNSAVIQRITIDVPIEISLNATIIKEGGNPTRNIEITTKITTKSDISENMALILWLIEDGIVGYQNDGGNQRNDYTHNHVLRTVINGLWGENFSVSPAAGMYEKSITYEAKENKWKLENCSVVGVVINTTTKEIITAGKTKIS